MLSRSPFRQSLGFACGVFAVTAATILFAQDKPEPPRIALAAPFALPPNATTKVLVRGWKLNREITATTPACDVMLKVLKHESVGAPNGQDVKQIGDSLVELEVTIPKDFSAESITLTFAADSQESTPYLLLVGGPQPVIAEIEPNDSFRQAQSIAVPQIVDGQLHADRNVDVYAMEFTAPQRLQVQVVARRKGSNLDSLLTLFDVKGRVVATNDDTYGADSQLDETLPAGRYYLVVQDAHDHGGPAHPYRLIVN